MGAERRRSRWNLLATVRARATIAATAVVALALLAGTFLQRSEVRRHLEQSAQASAELRARDVAERAGTGSLPRSLALSDDDTDFLQVVDTNGRVLAASDNVETVRPIADFAPQADNDDGDDRDDDPGDADETDDESEIEDDDVVARTLSDVPVDDGGRWRVVAIEANAPDGPVVVYSGASLEAADDALDTLARSQFIGLPLLLALVAVVTWLVVRRSLRPVEAIRAEVAGITTHDLHRRVPEPTSRDEIGRLAVTMNATLDRLEASLEQQRRFVADASHELRSPIAALRTHLEVALAHKSRADWVATVEHALADTTRLETLAADLLLLARLDATGPTHAHESVDVGELVAEELHQRPPAAPGLERRVRLDADVIVTADPTQLTRALRNLLDNAERHARAVVTVTVRTEGEWALLEVTDDGAGVAPDDRERVFERFTRLDDARSRDGGGTGLGLALVREVATAHGGATHVADNPTGGARLVVRLPRTD